MVSFLDVLTSSAAKWAAALFLAALALLWVAWSRYFKQASDLKLSVATLLEVISIGITSVSILLPAVGALLLYYLSRIPEEHLSTAYPLVVVIMTLGSSLFLGMWNAFSFGTQNRGGENLVWTRDHIGHALFFAGQGVLFFVSVIILTLFFLLTPLDVSGLLKQP